MPMMESLRTFTLRTLTGHTYQVVKKEPVNIAPPAVKAAIEAGMIHCNEDEFPQEAIPNAAPEGETRDDKIRQSMRDLTARAENGEQGLFSGGGVPTVPELSRVLGFSVNRAERDRLWKEVKSEPDTEE